MFLACPSFMFGCLFGGRKANQNAIIKSTELHWYLTEYFFLNTYRNHTTSWCPRPFSSFSLLLQQQYDLSLLHPHTQTRRHTPNPTWTKLNSSAFKVLNSASHQSLAASWSRKNGRRLPQVVWIWFDQSVFMCLHSYPVFHATSSCPTEIVS